MALGEIVLIALVMSGAFYLEYDIKRRKAKAAFEQEQTLKGFIKFVDRFKNERWGKPEDVQQWQIEEAESIEKEKLINRIIAEINNFMPSQRYDTEQPYQIELFDYLKPAFPEAEMEKQVESSRPDIVIGDVAIEIKGPTESSDLRTISDKCVRYYHHFNELLLVLFDVQIFERRYNEWAQSLQEAFPNVRVIRK